LLKKLQKDSTEYVYCEQRVNSLKNILVCLYGSTGSLWNRYGNVLVFEDINRLSREVLTNLKKNNGGRRWCWYEELREQRTRDMQAEML
jgi:hypothetical protein